MLALCGRVLEFGLNLAQLVVLGRLDGPQVVSSRIIDGAKHLGAQPCCLLLAGLVLSS